VFDVGEGGGGTTGGTTGGTADCDSCEYDFTAYGAECCDSAWDIYGIDCATLEADYNWDCSGCECPGDGVTFIGGENSYNESLVYSLESSSTKEYYYSESNITRDELTGINIYRASEDSELLLISELAGTPEAFSDIDVQNGIEYTYAVTSVYDNGAFESEFSNIATAMPMSTITLGLSNGSVQSGDTLHLTLSMGNSDPVAGFQFDLTALPDYLTLAGAAPTARIPGDWSISTNVDGRVLGFSFSGTTIDAGDGDIFDLSFTSFAPEPSDVTVCTSGEIFSDSGANAFYVDGDCGLVDITVQGIDATVSYSGGPVDQGETFSVSVTMENPEEVAGFELHLQDVPESMNAVSVTLSPELEVLGGMSDMSNVNGEAIILWFSLTGATIPANFGDLLSVEYEVASDAPDGDVDLSFGSLTTFSTSLGQSMFWNGTGTSVPVGLPDVYLSLVQNHYYPYELHMYYC
jgi:hypothetical protein